MRLPTPPVDLCKSVQSVGELFWLRGVYPPTEQTGRGYSPTDFTDSHRWLVALVAAWVWQDAIPSYICVNPCYLWETFLCKKLLWVPCVLWETLLYKKLLFVLWEYSSPTDCTDQHRWLGALVAAWVWQDAIPSYICVNPCYLWETFLCKKLLCVPWVLWEYSSPTDCTDQYRWLVALVAAWVRQDAIPSYICVNLCYLWETLLCKKLLCVPWVLWEYHCLLGWCSRESCTH